MEDWELQPARDHGLSPRQRSASLQREAGLLETTGHVLWRSGIRGYLRLYHRLRIVHSERLPTKPPFILLCNHSSHLDALVLSAVLPLKLADCVYPVAAGDVFFRTPAVAWFSAAMINALPMWRKNCGAHAMATLRAKLLEEACGYILFPEGTRSRDGRLGAFKSGLGMLVAGTAIPVIPCHLRGAHAALPPARRFPRPSRLTLAVGEAMQFAGVANDRSGWGEVAAAAQAAVGRLAEE